MPTRKQVTLPVGNSRDVLVTITRDGAPWDLTGATVFAVLFTASGSTLPDLTEANGRIVVQDAPGGVVVMRLDGDDMPTPGVYTSLLQVVEAGADDPETVLEVVVAVTALGDPGVASVRAIIGNADPPSDAAISAAVASVGVQNAAIQFLRERRATLLANPLKVTLDGDYTEDWSANVKALDALIATVAKETEAAVAAVEGGLTTGRLVRPERARGVPRSRR